EDVQQQQPQVVEIVRIIRHFEHRSNEHEILLVRLRFEQRQSLGQPPRPKIFPGESMDVRIAQLRQSGQYVRLDVAVVVGQQPYQPRIEPWESHPTETA